MTFFSIKIITLHTQYNKLVESALKNDTHGTIVHVNSGGFWPGISYQSKTTHNKLFICEAGPIENDSTVFLISLKKYMEKSIP